MSEQCKVVLVVGIIGSGKTSLCRELGEELGALVLCEQAQEHGNPFIDDFYKDKRRWAFTLQVYQLGARYSQHQRALRHVLDGAGHAVVDGGFWLDTCFARMVTRAGLMEEREYLAYAKIFRNMVPESLHPNIVIWLDAAPQAAMGRIAARAVRHPERTSEAEQVTVGYLADLRREIGTMCTELGKKGTEVIVSFYDETRDTPELRRQTVEGLAKRVLEHESPDPILAGWRRQT